jgi:hypothetical protein
MVSGLPEIATFAELTPGPRALRDCGMSSPCSSRIFSASSISPALVVAGKRLKIGERAQRIGDVIVRIAEEPVLDGSASCGVPLPHRSRPQHQRLRRG